MWPDVGAQGLGGYQLNRLLQESLQQIAELKEVIEALLVRIEFYQKVDIAAWSGLAADDGAEDRQATYAKASNLILGLLQTSNYSTESQCARAHNHNLDHRIKERYASGDAWWQR